MDFENGQATFEPGEFGRQERLALDLPETAANSMSIEDLHSLVLPKLSEISRQRAAGEPVNLHVMGIRQAIAGDLMKHYPQ